ncbi:TFIIH basal transcription factor complex p44 subunit, putative [Entamoeba invadens IP1]|uniref:TFIIH basal transcription factor complex p44 subunit, putative n=1 Tax=Entamoeba invadens IP1 TaxID=370355 RepID=A0A0A1U7Y5_ENTIV|nr:TFIIH basal transcription factor complex p44 subunit, putative [Entamoeba invadens IP1]ELP89180.1 TFIIH basal transcription factor complex p44 subunit, putative [Entamoeba invadens IP1]|eukprot:XP_004255951.1 TFIIH basal transcription factor complex p44 subunit, putative [Entamoeba invadens IP1]
MKKKQEDSQISSTFESWKTWERRNEFSADSRSRRGLQRSVLFVIDMSYPMNYEDFHPTRISFINTKMNNFFDNFFVDNPLSQIGLVATRNSTADIICPLTRNISKLKETAWGKCNGSISVQISLELCLQFLKDTKDMTSREIVFVTSAISTCDPGNIFETIGKVRDNLIRVSVISISAEVHVMRQMTKVTGGDYFTIMNEKHAEEVIKTFIEPPRYKATGKEPKVELLFVGFPRELERSTICECHSKIGLGHYECPVCGFCYCELPVECKVCKANLIFSHHFARSFHFLFPVKPFVLEKEPEVCFACGKKYEEKKDEEMKFWKCEKCSKSFCETCNIFIHDVLFNCPGCENNKVVLSN